MFHKNKFIILGFILLYKPGVIAGMPQLSILDTMINMLRLVFIFYIAWQFVNRKLPVNILLKVLLLIVIVEMWRIISTLINGHSYAGWGAFLNTIGISLFSYMALSIDPKVFIKGGALTLGAYVIINCLSILLFPAGVYASVKYSANFFLGYRTTWVPFYVIAFLFVLLWHECDQERASKVWLFMVFFAGIISMVLVWTSTGLVAFFCGGLYLIVCKKKTIAKAINMFTVLTISIGISVGLVLMNLQERFSFLIVNILQKDITLSERLRIWENAVYSIKEHPWVGVGCINTDTAKMILHWGATHAHNTFLNEMFYYGVIGLALYIVLLYFSANKLPKNGKLLPLSIIVMATYVVLMVSFQVEAYATIYYYLCPVYLTSSFICDIGRRYYRQEGKN